MVPAGIAMTAVITLLQAFWGVAYSGLVANQSRMEEALLKRVLLIESQFLRTREHDEFSKRLDAQLKKDEERIEAFAPRAEIDARLSTNAAALQQLRGDIDGFKRDFGQTYSVKDALAQIQVRLERMETWTKGAKPQ